MVPLENLDKIPEEELLPPKAIRGLIAGPSSVGKTSLLLKLIEETIFGSYYHRIYMVYPSIVDCHNDDESEFLARLEAIPNLEILEAVPSTKEELAGLILDPNSDYLLLLDDSQSQVFKSPLIDEIYRRLSSHMKIHVVACVQNIFSRDPYFQSVFRSCNYLIVFRPTSDIGSLACLGQKCYGPGGGHFLTSAMDIMVSLLGSRAYVCMDMTVGRASNISYPIKSLLVEDPVSSIKWPLVFKRSR